MPLILHHHPFTRASSVVLMLEEVGCDYVLEYVDLLEGEHKRPEILALNPMGKLPVLVDGDVVVTEVAAIGLYLADRYAPVRLAPVLDDPDRGTYLRWAMFGPSVVEPASYARGAKWDYQAAQAGWGTFEAMMASLEAAIGDGPWVLGERFSMVDVILGATVRYLLRFEMLEPRDALVDYAERLSARPAIQRGDAVNARIVDERGLSRRST